jgi:hypothetical protein
MRVFRPGLHMRLIRRRDHVVCRAEIVREGASLPILLVEGEPFPPTEAGGYFLAEASAGAATSSSWPSEGRSCHEGGGPCPRLKASPRSNSGSSVSSITGNGT